MAINYELETRASNKRGPHRVSKMSADFRRQKRTLWTQQGAAPLVTFFCSNTSIAFATSLYKFLLLVLIHAEEAGTERCCSFSHRKISKCGSVLPLYIAKFGRVQRCNVFIVGNGIWKDSYHTSESCTFALLFSLSIFLDETGTLSVTISQIWPRSPASLQKWFRKVRLRTCFLLQRIDRFRWVVIQVLLVVIQEKLAPSW